MNYYQVYKSVKELEAFHVQNAIEAVSYVANLKANGQSYIITSRYLTSNMNLIYSAKTLLEAFMLEDSLIILNGNALLEPIQDYVDSFFCLN